MAGDISSTMTEANVPAQNKRREGLKAARKKSLPSETTNISSTKARKMLREGTAHGKSLTEKQRGFLGAVAGKGRQ